MRRMDRWVDKQQPIDYTAGESRPYLIFCVSPFPHPTLSTLNTALHIVDAQQMFIDDDVDCGFIREGYESGLIWFLTVKSPKMVASILSQSKDAHRHLDQSCGGTSQII